MGASEDFVGSCGIVTRATKHFVPFFSKTCNKCRY